MIEILRIGLKYKKPLSRLSVEDKAYILDGLFALSNDETFNIRDDNIGDLLLLIQKENENMCKRAKNKQKVSDENNIGLRPIPMVEPMVDTKEKEKEKEKENIYMDLEKYLSKWNEIFGKNYELTEDLKKAYKTCRNKYTLEQIQIASSNYYKDKVSKRTKEERKQYELHIIKFLSQKNGLPTYL